MTIMRVTAMLQSFEFWFLSLIEQTYQFFVCNAKYTMDDMPQVVLIITRLTHLAACICISQRE